jgi:phosphate starvation-inducible protein PhoH
MTNPKRGKNAKNTEITLNQMRHITLNDRQEEYKEYILSNKVTFCHGPAGTSKTFTTIYIG